MNGMEDPPPQIGNPPKRPCTGGGCKESPANSVPLSAGWNPFVSQHCSLSGNSIQQYAGAGAGGTMQPYNDQAAHLSLLPYQNGNTNVYQSNGFAGNGSFNGFGRGFGPCMASANYLGQQNGNGNGYQVLMGSGQGRMTPQSQQTASIHTLGGSTLPFRTLNGNQTPLSLEESAISQQAVRTLPRPVPLRPPPLRPENSTSSLSSVENGETRRKRIIDLTLEDDDECVVVSESIAKPKSNPLSTAIPKPVNQRHTPQMSATPTPVEQVCAGMLSNVMIRCHVVPSPRVGMDRFPDCWPLIPVELTYRGNDHYGVMDYTRREFGVLDVRTAKAIQTLLEKKVIRAQTRLLPRRKLGEKVHQSWQGDLQAYINVYCNEPALELVGRVLHGAGVRLEDPRNINPSCIYKNPHILYGMMNADVKTMENTQLALENMFTDLQKKSDNYPEKEQDHRVKTPLLKHQKQGLWFMTKREQPEQIDEVNSKGESLWKWRRKPSGEIEYLYTLTNEVRKERPPSVFGGILADVMGLGKTLSILSLIASTLDEARAFSNKEIVSDQQDRLAPVLTTGATLLVTPTSTIVNWEEQIKCHIKEGELTYYVYHGKRERDIENLAKYDVIITTFNILGGEVQKALKDIEEKKFTYDTPLLKLKFFRMVLDEAHTIREQKTQMFIGAHRVSAERRWAVTGTPIQNNLKDFHALIRFLRAEPFMRPEVFTTFITSPFKAANPDGLRRLRVLVDSITLRRGKDKINLPKRTDKIVYLDFSPEEQEVYDKIHRQSNARFEMVVKTLQKKNGKALGGNNFAHILESILKLRLVCAHGKDLLGEADMAGLSSDHAINIDDMEDTGPGMDPKQAYSMYRLMREANENVCATCGDKPFRPDADSVDKTIGYLTPCFHFLCRKCLGDYNKAIRQKVQMGRYVCTICDTTVSKEPFVLKSDEVEMHCEKEKKKKKLGPYTGPSTKVRMLLQELHRDKNAYSYGANGDMGKVKQDPGLLNDTEKQNQWDVDKMVKSLDDTGIKLENIDEKHGNQPQGTMNGSFMDRQSDALKLEAGIEADTKGTGFSDVRFKQERDSYVQSSDEEDGNETKQVASISENSGTPVKTEDPVKTETAEAPQIEKSVVFSTWTTHMDLIGKALDAHSIKFVRLDGSMTVRQRAAVIAQFRDDPTIQVMLISIMAGGLGLNLTCASKVYVMEPLFNPACEAQAVDRVHRLGQKREVTVVRFIMKDSFEQNILKLQQRKRDLANLSMSGKLDQGKLTHKKLQDLALLFK